MAYKAQRIRDPLHNLIQFEADEFEDALWRVVQTRPFQRLRRIKQLGFSDLVYPGATHSRFAHSVGVFHTARQLMRVIKASLGEARFRPSHAQRALAAALVHDLGHGPFSHAFEDVGRRLGLKLAAHETVTDMLVRGSEVRDALKSLGSGFPDDVAEVIRSAGPGNIYSAVVSSQFDADRLDYIRRDRLMTGTQHGAIDFDWLIANLEVGELQSGVDEKPVGKLETLVLGPKAVHAAETYVLGLFQLYPTVYFHKTTRSAEKMFTALLERCIALIRDGSVDRIGLSAGHPLVRFGREPDKVEHVLSLDDTVIWGALPVMAEASDSLVSDFAGRLRDRRLYKCVDVRARLGLALGSSGEAVMSVDRACATIKENVAQWCAKNGGIRILVDEAEREPYKGLQESKGPLNQIMMKTTNGEFVDLEDRSRVVRSIETFKLFRLYVAESDQAARKYVDAVIDREVKNGKGNSP